ncbi:DUF937 domain-containing protein [bacterium]|nr:DUF937 domain-containing protein [candidate division CSSED10-310 bacterium]
MNINDILAQMGGFKSMANELGVTEKQASAGASALIPALLGGLKKQAQIQPGGIEGLGSMLGKLGGAELLDEVLATHPTDVSHGNNILGQIFGSKDVSRTVAQDASTKTGLDPSILKKMLPMLAMLVTGVMSKQQHTVEATKQAPSAGGLGGLLSGLLGGGSGGGGLSGIASMLDLDGDGNPLDDILGLFGGKKG